MGRVLNIDFLANGNSVAAVDFGLVELNSLVEVIRVYDETDALIATFNNQLTNAFSLWGVAATAGERIGRVELDGDFFAIQDIAFGDLQANAVPEPVSLLLVGLGLAAVGAARRRKT